MVNYNYPESFENIFDDIELNITFTGTQKGEDFDFELEINSKYTNEPTWFNRWTGSEVVPGKFQTISAQDKKFSTFSYRKDAMKNLDTVSFDVFDTVQNQVLFFDFFVEKDSDGNILEKDPFGTLSIYGRPYSWMELENAWNGIDLIVQNYYF